jgi:hypothetical protein
VSIAVPKIITNVINDLRETVGSPNMPQFYLLINAICEPAPTRIPDRIS